MNNKLIKIKVYNIDYDLNDEDAFAANKSIDELKSSLPNELFLNVNEIDLMSDEVILADKISNETGYLIKNFEYEIL